jgi:hypothetical protein
MLKPVRLIIGKAYGGQALGLGTDPLAAIFFFRKLSNLQIHR